MKKSEKPDRKTPISVALVEAISEQTRLEMTDFSLYDSIDPDALDTLFSGDRPQVGDVRVVFDILDHTVVVERVDETVTVRVNE